MSRRISPGSSVTVTEEERKLYETDDGKMIFTKYKGRPGAFFVRGDRLLAASVFPPESSDAIGTVYVGKVCHVVHNIDACFVEIEEKEVCFLPLDKAKEPFLTNRTFDGRILEGDEILVQMERKAQKNKQPSVTTRISLVNDYFALTLGSGSRVSFSAKLDRNVRDTVSDLFAKKGLLTPEGGLCQEPAVLFPDAEKPALCSQTFPLPSVGVIVRTRAGMVREMQEKDGLLPHFYELTGKLFRLLRDARTRSSRSCLLKAAPAWEDALSHLTYPEEYREIVTDDPTLFEEMSRYCADHFPEMKLRLYQDADFSLARLYSLESRIEAALKPKVWLKSGGYLVIEPTEALTVIDVNSGKNETGREQEQAVRKLNREAAAEIAIQLRLRNLSGIILVDFVNMSRKESEQELLEFLRALVRRDHVRTTVVDITPLGLVELTRKKGYPPLSEQLQRTGKDADTDETDRISEGI